jgi:hypothetical protein
VRAASAVRAMIEDTHGELAQWHVLPFTPGREVLPDLGKLSASGDTGSTSIGPDADLAKLLRETVVISAAAANSIATGPPDG